MYQLAMDKEVFIMEKNRNRSDTQKPIPGSPDEDKDKKDIDREFEQNTPHIHEDERAEFKPKGGMENDPYRGKRTEKPDSTRSNPL
jgi:hypothetical protein